VNKISAFNTLFDAGINYDDYLLLTSERVQGKMADASEATEKIIKNVSSKKMEPLHQKLRILCITHVRCKDSANALPVISKLSESVPEWEFKIVQRDDFSDEVESYYLTAGRKKVPVIIFADEEGEEIIRWVERPTKSYEILSELQAERLNKEEYIIKYKSIPELKSPLVTENILDEFVNLASKAANMIKLLPKKKPSKQITN
jgi:hypothetical protein